MFDGGGEEGAWVFKGTPREAENPPQPTFGKNQRSWQGTGALPGPERASIDAPSAALSLAGRFPALPASVSGCGLTLRQPAPQNQGLNACLPRRPFTPRHTPDLLTTWGRPC